MPAVGKITLDIKDYEKSLAKARQQGQNFSRGMQQDFKSVGSGASKAGTVISAMGSQAGGAFGKLGGIISAVTSGPIVAMTAALGALVALGVDIWDRMTLSAEEYAKKQDMIAQRADKNREAVEKQVAEDETYIERLRELGEKETLSNEAKTEAATLIKNLSARYGDLGLSIDEVTGALKGADEAQKRFLERAKEQRMKAVREQMNATRRQAASQAKMSVTESTWWGSRLRGQRMSAVNSVMRPGVPIEEQIKMAERFRDTATRKSDMDNWQKLVDLLTKQRDLQREYNQLRKTGAATEKEDAGRMKKQTDKAQQKVDEEKAARNTLEKKTDDYYSGTISSMERQLAIQRLINAGKYEEAEQLKRIAELEKQGIAADARSLTMNNLQKKLNAEKLRGAQGQQASSLYDRALLAAGRGTEADTRAALENARKAKGGDLTQEEKSRTLELLGLSQQLDKLTGYNFAGMAIQTNSLTARGGFSSGAVVPDAEKYNRIIADNGKTMLSVVQRIETICRQFGTF